MFFRDFGSGPVVLFLHGTPSPAADWLPIAERLSASHRVLIPDLPGYGQSPPATDATYEKVDVALAAELSALGARQLRGVVGFSTGAYRAFELVLRRRVKTEVLVGIGAIATFDDAGRAFRRQMAQALRANPEFRHGPEVREAFRQLMLSPGWVAAHPEDLERVFRWVDLIAPAALADELDALAAVPDLRPDLAGLAARLYLRVGELDLGAPPAVSQELQKLVPGSTLDVVPGCGHTLLIEDVEGTASALARVLAG
jgi:pimeloyl-ACP methyl ester carboxylesterase